jgi:uncharacterized protein
MAERVEVPHLPRQAPIDAYGNGGFRFAGLSHRGSLLCLPSGIWAWPPATATEIDEVALLPIFAEASAIELFLLGVGAGMWLLPETLRRQFKEHRVVIEVMTTGAAVRTYNIVLGENRRVGAGLIAVS